MVTLGVATPFITNNITSKGGGCHAHFKVDQHDDPQASWPVGYKNQAKKERPPDDETFFFLTHKDKFPTLRLIRGKFSSNNQLPSDQKNIIIPLN